jgi:hypothetical protein
MKSKHLKYRAKGAFIAEGAASLLLMLPVIITVIYVAFEASKCWLIQQTLDHACREATRLLAEEYAMEGGYNQVTSTLPTIVTNTTNQQQTLVFNNLRVHDIIASSSQFTGGSNKLWGGTNANVTNPIWVIPAYTATNNYGNSVIGSATTPNTSANASGAAQLTPSVTVTVTFQGGAAGGFGLPSFPDIIADWWGAKFNLGTNFKMSSTSTYYLENQ